MLPWCIITVGQARRAGDCDRRSSLRQQESNKGETEIICIETIDILCTIISDDYDVRPYNIIRYTEHMV